MGETGVPEPQEIPPEGQLGRGLNVRGAAKGPLGHITLHQPEAKENLALGRRAPGASEMT